MLDVCGRQNEPRDWKGISLSYTMDHKLNWTQPYFYCIERKLLTCIIFLCIYICVCMHVEAKVGILSSWDTLYFICWSRISHWTQSPWTWVSLTIQLVPGSSVSASWVQGLQAATILGIWTLVFMLAQQVLFSLNNPLNPGKGDLIHQKCIMEGILMFEENDK